MEDASKFKSSFHSVKSAREFLFQRGGREPPPQVLRGGCGKVAGNPPRPPATRVSWRLGRDLVRGVVGSSGKSGSGLEPTRSPVAGKWQGASPQSGGEGAGSMSAVQGAGAWGPLQVLRGTVGSPSRSRGKVVGSGGEPSSVLLSYSLGGKKKNSKKKIVLLKTLNHFPGHCACRSHP